MRNSQMQELARFVKLYEKFERQRDRRQAERPLLESAAEKMKTLANSSTAAQKGMSSAYLPEYNNQAEGFPRALLKLCVRDFILLC